MTSNTIQNIYFLTLLLYTCTEVVLLVLNRRSASIPFSDLPVSIQRVHDKETHIKSISYTNDKTRLAIVSTIYSSLLIFIVIKFSFFGVFDQYLREVVQNFYLRAWVYIMGISLIGSILQLPFSLYSTFVIEERYGFNKMTWGLWVKDLFKGTVLSVILFSPVLFGLLYFMNTFIDYWWVYGFILVAGFQLGIMMIYPSFIAPIFNKLEPLKDEQLKEDITSLADKLSFETNGIFQMDGSKRSSHGNAYFAGFGALRRIVLFDTLINKLSRAEVCAVLAHEIGHAKKYHVLQGVGISLLFLSTSFYIAALLLSNEAFFQAFGVTEASSYALLILFSTAFEPILFFLSPLTSILSRKNEYEADKYAVVAMAGATELETALVTLSKESLANLNPHPLYSFFHYSHPTLVERIEAMKGSD